MATITPINPEPRFNIAVTEAELTLLRSALTVMRNVRYAQGNGNLPDLLRGQVSLAQQEAALVLVQSLRTP